LSKLLTGRGPGARLGFTVVRATPFYRFEEDGKTLLQTATGVGGFLRALPHQPGHADLLLTIVLVLRLSWLLMAEVWGAVISKKTISRETTSVCSRVNALDAPVRHFAVLLIMTKYECNQEAALHLQSFQ
jgi:hypothetical protein